MEQKIIKFLFIFTIVFLLFLLPAKKVLGVNTPTSSEPTIQQAAFVEQLNELEKEIEQLRGENYQSVVQDSQKTVDKIDQYINRITNFATIFGVILTIFGLFLTVVTIFFSLNFISAKKEFTEQLKEIKNYVASAKKGAELVNRLCEGARKETKIVPQIIKDFQKNRLEMVQLLTKVKKTKTKKVKEFDDALTRIQEKETELSQKLLQAVNKIQAMNSQANIISGASVSSSYNLGTAKRRSWDLGTVPGEYTTETIPFENDKCSKCGKIISPFETLSGTIENPQFVSILGDNLCPECKKKGA